MATKSKLNELLQGSKPVLIEFYADWCPHCQRMMPIVNELIKEEGDKAYIVQIEGDNNPDLMKEYHVDSYPSWILYKDGQQVWRDGGEKPLSELKDMVDRFV